MAASDYQARVLADGAAAYWPLDDPAGSTAARDLAGTRHATINGPVTLDQPGIGRSKAMRLQVSARLLPPTHPGIGAGITLEIWGKLATLPTNVQAGLLSGQIYAAGDWDWHVRAEPRVTFWLMIPDASTNKIVQITVPEASTVGAWFHLVTTVVTGASGIAQHYFNGQPFGASLSAAYVSGPGAAPIGVGSYADPGNGFEGWLQDVAIYPRALTPAEIAAHYALKFTQVRLLPPDRSLSRMVQIQTDDKSATLNYAGIMCIHVSTDADGVWEYAPINEKKWQVNEPPPATRGATVRLWTADRRDSWTIDTDDHGNVLNVGGVLYVHVDTEPDGTWNFVPLNAR